LHVQQHRNLTVCQPFQGWGDASYAGRLHPPFSFPLEEKKTGGAPSKRKDASAGRFTLTRSAPAAGGRWLAGTVLLVRDGNVVTALVSWVRGARQESTVLLSPRVTRSLGSSRQVPASMEWDCKCLLLSCGIATLAAPCRGNERRETRDESDRRTSLPRPPQERVTCGDRSRSRFLFRTPHL